MFSTYFGDKPFWRIALRLSLPIALQNMLTSSFALIDTLMVSRLGDLALSAVGMAGQWSWFLTLILFGLTSGMSVFASQYWGVDDHKGMRRVLGISLTFALLASFAFTLFAAAMPEHIMRLFNQEAEVVSVGTDYLRIACWSYPAVALTLLLSGFLRSIEKVRVPMVVSAFTTFGNAILNYALIFGKLGLPALGVRGAAAATCISSWMGPVLLLVVSLAQKNHLVRHPRDMVSFRAHHIAAFFKRAFPVIFNETLWGFGIFILQMIYANMGHEYYAAVSIVRTLVELSFSFFAGLGNACVIMVGKSVGSGKIRRAVDDARRFGFLVPLVAFVIGLLLALLRDPLIRIFDLGNNISDLTLQTARTITLFIGLEMMIRMIPYIQIVGIFRSGGDTFTGVLFDAGTLWVLAIPAAALASRVFHLPFTSVLMIAYLVEDLPKAVLCIGWYLSKKWIKPVTAEGKAGLEAYRIEMQKEKAL